MGVIAVKVAKGRIADRIEALGTLSANESVILTANITETVTGIFFEDGQLVERGTLLVDLRDDEEQALLQEVTSRAAEAKRQYDRIQPLQKGGAAPTALIDEKLREYETAKAQVLLLEARLQNRKIIAPFSGVLGLRNISVGALVSPGFAVVSLDDISVMKLDFTVPSIFLQSIAIGQKVIANARDLPEQEFSGEVASISSRVDPVTRSMVVRALIPNPQRSLRPGLLMTVNLFRDEREAILLPEESIVAEGEKKFVYIIDGTEQSGLLVKREVLTGAREPGKVEILSGVEVGEKVVIHGTVRARAGLKVHITGYKDESTSVKSLISPPQKEATNAAL